MSTHSNKKFRAFTLKSDKPLGFISLEIGVTEKNDTDQDVPSGQVRKYNARINTATQRSLISDRVISEVGLQSSEVNGEEVYFIDIYLPNVIRITGVPAGKLQEPLRNGEKQSDCVLAMDILSCGDVSLSHKDKTTMFSFRIPSLGAEDFVETHRKLHKGGMVTTAAARNSPCPCGSGKRYKNCCGKIF